MAVSVVLADVDAAAYVSAPPVVWPTVAALNRPGITSWSQAGETTLPRFTPATAGAQPGEKQPVPVAPVKVEWVDAPFATYGNTIDLSLQARRVTRSQEPFREILSAATARESNRYVLSQLHAAAGAPLASLSAAVRAVAGFGGTILIITSAIEGAASLLAAERASGGRVRVVVDPDNDSTLAVALLGVALEVKGISGLEAPNLPLHGQDIATYATIVGPVCAPGAVALGELQTGGGGGGSLTWSDV